MLNNYFTILQVSKFLSNELTGFIIPEIYTQEKNKLLIELTGKDELIIVLEFSVEKDYNYLLIKRNFSKAKKNYAALFDECNGKRIEAISLFNDDRIINFDLGNNLKLLFTFFTLQANCFLINNGIVTDAFKNKQSFEGKSISEIINPVKKPGEKIKEDITAGEYVRKNFRKFGDLYMKEAIFRSKVIKDSIADDETKTKIENAFTKIENELTVPVFLTYNDDKGLSLSLLKLDHKSVSDKKEFDDINSMLTEFVSKKFKREKTDSLRDTRIKEIEKKIKLAQHKADSLRVQLEHSMNSDELRIKGDLILQNIHDIKKGDNEFIYLPGLPDEVRIKLKEELSPSENAAVYFEKYKKQKKSVSILKDKIIEMNQAKLKLEQELDKIKEITELKTLMKEEKKITADKNDETSRFRKFAINDKYEVWVGKDSASNDLLTTRHSAQNDLWFHVRGASGSHTVLKTGNRKEDIPKDVIHSAAAIAAYYSKARNASSAPVAYCERKFVKKKKGFAQGAVMMEREKVVFVKPGLPLS